MNVNHFNPSVISRAFHIQVVPVFMDIYFEIIIIKFA